MLDRSNSSTGKLYIIWISLIGLISVCFSSQAGYLPPPKNPFPTTQTPFYLNNNINQRQLGYFTTLIVSGNIDIDLKTGVNEYQMTMTGNLEEIKNLYVQESNETLVISANNNLFSDRKPLHVDISTQFLNDLRLKNYAGHFQASNFNTPYLNANLDNDGLVLLSGNIGLHDLVVSGSGKTQIQGINSQSLQIEMSENPTISLSGVANLESLSTKGSGQLRLYWVNSDKLHIHVEDKSYIVLAGIANFVEMELFDQARFSGRYLRVKDGYTKTWNNSTADVQFLKAQSMLSNDNSHINFYGKPPFKANFMGKNGAILDMEDH